MGLSKIEQWASPLWRKVQPLASKYLPPTTPIKAFPLGMIWGWLPCGLVYSILPIAYSAGSIQNAALVMLSFGLATLPMLMLLGKSALLIKAKMQNKTLRRVLGIILILWGITQILGIAPFMSHGTNHELMQH